MDRTIGLSLPGATPVDEGRVYSPGRLTRDDGQMKIGGIDMLKEFFKLNPDFKTIDTEEDLLEIIEHGDGVRDILFKPDIFAPARPLNKIRGKKFTNVSFTKTVLDGLEFTKCEFVDCLFIGSIIRNCEFHDCTFEGCNPYKILFESTYIDPRVFTTILNPKVHSNIGVGLFQRLLQNSRSCHQPEFARQALYLFQKWKRYQLSYAFSQGKIGKREYLKKWLPSVLYDYLAGYGIRVLPFVRLTIVLLVVCTIFNHFAWGSYHMHNTTEMASKARPIVSFYYTVITMTTLGYGDYTPTTPFGMLAASGQSVLGILWLSALASIIINRVSK